MRREDDGRTARAAYVVKVLPEDIARAGVESRSRLVEDEHPGIVEERPYDLHPPAAPRAALLADLTDREREVVALVAAGLNNDEIGERLVISPATARTHVSRAMSKIDARDRAQVVVFAYETGLVSPSRST